MLPKNVKGGVEIVGSQAVVRVQLRDEPRARGSDTSIPRCSLAPVFLVSDDSEPRVFKACDDAQRVASGGAVVDENRLPVLPSLYDQAFHALVGETIRLIK